MLNPLAIGVTVGGLLLDVLCPRPKPRVGAVNESLLLSPYAVSRTPRRSVSSGSTTSNRPRADSLV